MEPTPPAPRHPHHDAAEDDPSPPDEMARGTEEAVPSRTAQTVLRKHANRVRAEVGKILVGQTQMVDLLLTALLAEGHVLIEGVPGVAKTLTAKLLARTLDVQFTRIQFTPDLMPSDVLGTSVFDPEAGTFTFKRGPVFSNVVLIDEINRAPAKTQAALFEVMEERQVSVDGTTYPLPPPFVVFATQNPLEHEGTYRLPEAQLDRFLFKVVVGYPSAEEELAILQGHHAGRTPDHLELVRPVLDDADLGGMRERVRAVHVEEGVLRYMAQITQQTRDHAALFLGASPRATVALLRASKAFAALQGRDFVTPEDVQEVVAPVLRHRILLTAEQEMEGLRTDDVLRRLLQQVEVPR